MKKFNTFKIVQLVLLIILTAVSLYMLMQPEVKQYIFDSTPATAVCTANHHALLQQHGD